MIPLYMTLLGNLGCELWTKELFMIPRLKVFHLCKKKSLLLIKEMNVSINLIKMV
jgi:hypothetical protein